jgi:O-antigen/teichoic acid export membrane protein
MATGISMLFNLPIMMGLAMLSDLVIEVLFGRNWLASAPALSALAIAGILLPMHSINMQMILAQGDGGVFIRNEIIKKSLGIACVIVGSLFGIFGLACSQIAYSILAFFLNAQPARRALNYGAVNQLLDLKGIFFTSAAMVAVLVPLKHSMSSTSPAVALLVLVTAGGVVFVGLGWLARVRAFKDLLAMLPAGRGGGRLLRWLQPNH